jgi:hypothetical protein
MTVAAHIVGGLGDLHALTMEQREALTEEEAKSLIYATQWFCAGVATYILFIWSLKMNVSISMHANNGANEGVGMLMPLTYRCSSSISV